MLNPTIVINEQIIIPQVMRIMLLAVIAFLFAMAITPIFTHFAYKYQWWRKQRELDVTGNKAVVFQKLHKEKHKRNIPTMAGLIVVITVSLITLFFNLDRSETWLPLAALAIFGGLGLVDDFTNIFNRSDKTGGLRAKTQLAALIGLSFICALWFYYKLGYSIVHIPAWGDVSIGWLYIPLFVFIVVASAKSVSITDGLDGLAGGTLSFAFGSYAIIAYLNGLTSLATFCATMVGALFAYTWFNIYPARFFMGQVGSTALGAALGVVVMLTNTVLVLPIIGFIFVVETLSVIIQLLSKKFLKRKVFLSAPIHHHFEAKGWPETKVTMRFWVIGWIMSILGIIIALFGRGS
jgi:phospho-N-acetylmuramoyl-pentapeptide-transferase